MLYNNSEQSIHSIDDAAFQPAACELGVRSEE
jgi:hypothetical protein